MHVHNTIAVQLKETDYIALSIAHFSLMCPVSVNTSVM